MTGCASIAGYDAAAVDTAPYETPVAVRDRVTLVLARNPGPMTLSGTNTWRLSGPGREDAVVIDPGPEDEEHLTAVAEVGPVALVLLTHRHADHAAGARRFAELTGAPVRALDPALLLGAEGLAHDEEVTAAGVTLRVIATPGHTDDSLSFLLLDEDSVLTGDHVLGAGTTVVEHPDGRLGDYLDSLERIRDLGPMTVLPGHGPVLPDAAAVASAYLEHRRTRLAQVSAALDAGARTPREVVEVVYADVDRRVWDAAELSVRAQLEHLGRS